MLDLNREGLQEGIRKPPSALPYPWSSHQKRLNIPAGKELRYSFIKPCTFSQYSWIRQLWKSAPVSSQTWMMCSYKHKLRLSCRHFLWEVILYKQQFHVCLYQAWLHDLVHFSYVFFAQLTVQLAFWETASDSNSWRTKILQVTFYTEGEMH